MAFSVAAAAATTSSSTTALTEDDEDDLRSDSARLAIAGLGMALGVGCMAGGMGVVALAGYSASEAKVRYYDALSDQARGRFLDLMRLLHTLEFGEAPSSAAELETTLVAVLRQFDREVQATEGEAAIVVSEVKNYTDRVAYQRMFDRSGDGTLSLLEYATMLVAMKIKASGRWQTSAKKDEEEEEEKKKEPPLPPVVLASLLDTDADGAVSPGEWASAQEMLAWLGLLDRASAKEGRSVATGSLATWVRQKTGAQDGRLAVDSPAFSEWCGVALDMGRGKETDMDKAFGV